MRPKALRVARNIVISIVVLLALIIGGFVGYTYFLGPDSSQTAATPVPVAASPVAKPDLIPPKPSPNAPVGASVQTITSPVAPGKNTSLTIKTTPLADCKITVVYGATPSNDSGLAAKKADEFGVVSWTWTVGADVPPGTYPVDVTCAYKAKSAMVRADLLVAKKAD